MAVRPVWLTVARAWARMNQTELARRARCSQAKISRIESGLYQPDDELAERLARALEIPKGLLSVPDSVVPPAFSFHRKKRTNKQDLDQLWARLNILRLALSRLLAQIELEPTLELPDVSLDDSTPEDVARRLRAAWMVSPGPIEDLTGLIESAGVVVLCFDFGIGAVDGVSHRGVGGLPPMIFLNTRAPGCRLRHTAAHELAHLLLHDYPTPEMEHEADAFAAEFLAPRREVRHLLRPPLELPRLANLKRSWRISMASLMYRAKSLGTITPDQYRRLVIKMAPYRRVEPVQIDVEAPTMAIEIVDYFRTELGYSEDDLIEATCLPVDSELFAALGIAQGKRATPDRPAELRLVNLADRRRA